MNYDEISIALSNIIEKRAELSKHSLPTPEYKNLKAELQKMEEDFLRRFGSTLHEILLDVHDEYAPDIEVLPVLQYIGKEYKKIGQNEWGIRYDVDYNQGVYVEVDDFLDKNTKLVLVPNPLRVILNIEDGVRQTVWSSLRVAAY
ncbi:MAG: hypothetical protein OHK0038_15460 [Flammeovirgaceae bacterium]